MTPGAALELRDIHLPAAPGWWPPAPGWWLLALLLLVLGALGLRYIRRWLLRRAQRRSLRLALAALRRDHCDDGAAMLAGASELLRRASRQHAPDALPLQGEAWLRFLDGGREDAPFSAGAGRLLLDGPYRPAVDPAAAEAVLGLVERRLLELPGGRR
jgi:hypothetical protein